MSSSRNPQIYVGHLSRGVRESQVYDEFNKFGKIREVNLKSRYAFVEYYDYHNARDAIHALDNRRVFNGERIQVEHTLKNSNGGGERSGRGGGPQQADKCFKCQRNGHWARDCPEKRGGRSRSRERDLDRKEGRCFVCKKKGHRARECREERDGGRRSRSRSRSRGSYDSRDMKRGSGRRDNRRDTRRYSRSLSGGRSRSPPSQQRDRRNGGGRGGNDRRRSTSQQSRDRSPSHGRQGYDRRRSHSPYSRDDQYSKDRSMQNSRSRSRGSYDRRRGPRQDTQDKNRDMDRRSGDRRSGERRSGERRSGDRRSGDRRSGDRRSGDRRSGDRQSRGGSPRNGSFKSISDGAQRDVKRSYSREDSLRRSRGRSHSVPSKVNDAQMRNGDIEIKTKPELDEMKPENAEINGRHADEKPVVEAEQEKKPEVEQHEQKVDQGNKVEVPEKTQEAAETKQ